MRDRYEALFNSEEQGLEGKALGVGRPFPAQAMEPTLNYLADYGLAIEPPNDPFVRYASTEEVARVSGQDASNFLEFFRKSRTYRKDISDHEQRARVGRFEADRANGLLLRHMIVRPSLLNQEVSPLYHALHDPHTAAKRIKIPLKVPVGALDMADNIQLQTLNAFLREQGGLVIPGGNATLGRLGVQFEGAIDQPMPVPAE